MPDLVTVSRDKHQGKYWHKPASYSFAKKWSIISLVAMDVSHAAIRMPIGFLGGEDYAPAAILGEQPDNNLFITPNGKWMGGYIPAVLRTYPFMMVHREGKLVLCVFHGSGLLTDGPEGKPLFDESGGISPELQEVTDYLQKVEASRRSTMAACSVMQELGLFTPWQITTSSGSQIEGVYKIDEHALSQLSDSDFLRLRENHALPIAYSQLLSMGNLKVLKRMAASKPKLSSVEQELASLLTSAEDDLFDFD